MMNPMSARPETMTTLNERFLAFLDRQYAPNTPRHWYVLVGLTVGATAVTAILIAALILQINMLWPVIPFGVALLVRAGMAVRHRRQARQKLQHLRRVVQNGVPVTGYVVQAHASLLQPGDQTLPCLVLFSLQPEVDGDPEYMRYLADRIYKLKSQTLDDGDDRALASMINDDCVVPYRRRKLPLTLTDGSTIYCGDLWVKQSYLEGNCLKTNRLPCLAEPGEIGGIELVPVWLLDHARPVPQPDTRPVK